MTRTDYLFQVYRLHLCIGDWCANINVWLFTVSVASDACLTAHMLKRLPQNEPYLVGKKVRIAWLRYSE